MAVISKINRQKSRKPVRKQQVVQPTLFDLLDVRSFPHSESLAGAIEALSEVNTTEERGAVFTRSEVVGFILDLVGYLPSKPLHQHRILEPSFGEGDFLLPMIDRLLAAWRKHGGAMADAASQLGGAICAVELHRETFASVRRTVINRLVKEGFAAEVSVSLADQIRLPKLPKDSCVREVHGVVNGSEPWLLESSDQVLLLRNIEQRFPTLEEAGCKVGIGVATGADQAFIGKFDELDVEPDRKLPLVATSDIQSGEVAWRGQGVINPFAEDGSLVALERYPRLARYFEQRKAVVENRHCARKSPANWYRTIDRIWPDLTGRPKLLVPDIKGKAHVVYESGKLYPHHNLYYVISDTWDLRASVW